MSRSSVRDPGTRCSAAISFVQKVKEIGKDLFAALYEGQVATEGIIALHHIWPLAQLPRRLDDVRSTASYEQRWH